MNCSLNWLRHYVDIDMSPECLAEKLTLAGIAVENIIRLGEGLEGVVTGKVVEIVKHPEADKLWICTIDIAQSEPLTIVTGAQNVTQGAIVPVAVVGSRLPNGMKMKPAKLRGVQSMGMLCSTSELNLDNKTLLPEQREGIFILPSDTPIGQDIKQTLGLDDVILEFELTANRADCFGIIGIAREIASVTGAALKNIPQMPANIKIVKDSENLHINTEDTVLCPRFTGRVLEGVTIAPSPTWLQKILRSMGMRPINNIVDVTNFVMLELCRPMHAYDADTLRGKQLTARAAQSGEKLTTLDDQPRILTADMTVIADSERVVGLAGVMGGLATEVTENTKNIILESACFNGPNIRRTSRALGLRSEASGRFERGTDIEITPLSLCRATELLQSMTTIEKVYDLVDCYPQPVQPTILTVSTAKINTHLGTDISTEKMAAILNGLGFTVSITEDLLTLQAPSWRTDITGMVDISEEIARNIGFDNITASLPQGKVMLSEQTPVTGANDSLRDLLVADGLDEVITYSFIHPTAFDKLNLPAEHHLRQVIPIANPITDDFTVLRTTLLSSLLQATAYNNARRNDNVAIFEVGNTYIANVLPLKEFPTEIPVVAGVLTGKRNEIHWGGSKEDFDFYDVKGLVTNLLDKFAISGYELTRSNFAALHPGKSVDITLHGENIGYFGQIHPIVEKNYDFIKPVFVFELKVVPFIESGNKIAKYKVLPKYPFITRDLAIIIPNGTVSSDLHALVESAAGQYLVDFKLFDIYSGKQIQDGCKSVAFTLTFQAKDRTLTDAEVEAATKNVLDKLQEQYNLKLRS